MLESHYLDWNLPLTPAIAQRLLSYNQSKFIDLAHLLVVVPTVQSGRRLREALALEAAKNDQGILPPEIITPDGLLTHCLSELDLANEETMLAAWVTTLTHIDPAQFTTLFPVPPERTELWKTGMAQRLMQLRNELGEEGLNFAQVAERTAESGQEPERWRQLARLEALYLDQIQLAHQIDPKEARRHAANNYNAPVTAKRIILTATPDPQPLIISALEQAAQQIPIEVWIYGLDPELFDPWGRPVTEKWIHRPLQLESWGCHFHTEPTHQQIAESVTTLTKPQAPEAILIGLTDAELNPIVANQFTQAKIPFYDPEGQALNLTDIGRLTELLCQLPTDASLPLIRSLLIHPDFFNWLETSNSLRDHLADLDRTITEHLPAELTALAQFAHAPSLKTSLNKIQALQKRLQNTNFATTLAAVLKDIYSHKKQTNDPTQNEIASSIREILKNNQKAAELFKKLPSSYHQNALKHRISLAKTHDIRPRDAHDLLGWLELLWNDSPHLVLAGMNEGKVPESIFGDAFLPESLRQTLGLRTNEQRFARDAYLLEALCRRRANTDARIDILIPQSSQDTTPLKPSRLLFQCDRDTLLKRTKTLFAKPHHTPKIQTHSPAWKLNPPTGLPLPERISVSAFKNYLECPFRFFLRHILKMRTVDTTSRELTPATFGNLMHDILAELKGREITNKTNAAELEKELHSIADHKLLKQHGHQLSFALRLQRESIHARITAFCTHQFEFIQSNGSIQIIETESPFAYELNGFQIRGVIDRTDQRDQHTELIDYKTADSPKTPEQAHLKLVSKKEPPAHLPPQAFFEHEGKTYRWTDLQLPLYLLAQKIDAQQERPKVAYFNLAKTENKSGLSYWDDFTPSHIDSAHACAQGVIENIKSGIFWPPNPDVVPDFDDFAQLFPDGIENSVDADAFTSYTFASNNQESEH